MTRRVLALAALLTTALAPAAAAEYRASIKRSEHGVPHITARDWGSLAYGYGYSLAKDNLCVMADTYVTVRAQRSRFFGPDATHLQGGNGSRATNLNSDFFWKRIIDQGTVEKLITAPDGPVPQIDQGVRGYVAGYNRALREKPDARCADEPWATPITRMDAYRRFYQLALLASSGVAVDGIGGAAPAADPVAAAARQQRAMATLDRKDFDELLGGIGSNAVALGKAATKDGRGLLLGNPHFPWTGSERFYESHLTIPGKVDVAGASLLGVPLINIGFTKGLAWSHTVSTARRFTPFELKLVPGSPTTYLVDGQPREMQASEHTIQVRTEDGKLEERRRTLYSTEYGPVLTSILGLPIFPWTPATAYAMGDVNATVFGRLLNHFFFVNQAQDVPQLDRLLRKYVGIPWVNTIAADGQGRAYYADIGAVPHVTNEKIQTCSAPIGTVLDQYARLQVLDGSRSSCGWGSDPDSPAPGNFGPSSMPSLLRDDYVTNGNDSYWLSNPLAPLEGYPRIIGDERTARTPRTRLGLRIAQDGGKDWTPAELRAAMFNNRQYLGELWRDELVALCESRPFLLGSSGPVDVSEACPALKKWDLRDNTSSRGAVLFRRFAGRALGAAGGPWRTPFDPDDAVNTPNGLNTDHPQVQQALADAVADLRNAGIPFDAPLGDWQYVERGGERIPIHGGPGGVGVFNAINVTWDAEKGYPTVPHGSSYVQVVQPGGRCPDAQAILTYSQSTDPASKHYDDQTRLYSRKQWVPWRFCGRSARGARVLRGR
jgi:acyl-homoserine-lactone acylase